jgi:hypothetical protein
MPRSPMPHTASTQRRSCGSSDGLSSIDLMRCDYPALSTCTLAERLFLPRPNGCPAAPHRFVGSRHGNLFGTTRGGTWTRTVTTGHPAGWRRSERPLSASPMASRSGTGKTPYACLPVSFGSLRRRSSVARPALRITVRSLPWTELPKMGPSE